MIDPTDYPGIRAWVQEWGGDVDYLDYVKSRGDMGMVVAFSRIFWPRFVEVEGCVLWDRVYEESNFAAWRESLSGDMPKIEATLNQLRVWQIVDPGDGEEEWRAQRYFAECVAKTWSAALSAEFPHRHFEVRVIDTEDGPIVTFSSGLR
ncbi:hypothetical protein AB0G32_02270 [Streptomyces sp. NPDC023723]|uniref:hypothetical protein n=1 Tax=Streptomyces sp. NPDC023723 TaxID=3154323 RepID=UPI0033C7F6BA